MTAMTTVWRCQCLTLGSCVWTAAAVQWAWSSYTAGSTLPVRICRRHEKAMHSLFFLTYCEVNSYWCALGSRESICRGHSLDQQWSGMSDSVMAERKPAAKCAYMHAGASLAQMCSRLSCPACGRALSWRDVCNARPELASQDQQAPLSCVTILQAAMQALNAPACADAVDRLKQV